MATKIKVIGIESGYSSSVVEIPYREGLGFEVGDEVIFKDSEDKEEYGIIKYLNRDSVGDDRIIFTSKILVTNNNLSSKFSSNRRLASSRISLCLAASIWCCSLNI